MATMVARHLSHNHVSLWVESRRGGPILKAVHDFAAIQGGSVGLTPIVGDALIDPKFLERVRYLGSLPQIDRIVLTTNAILLDKFGIDAILDSGIDSSYDQRGGAYPKGFYARQSGKHLHWSTD